MRELDDNELENIGEDEQLCVEDENYMGKPEWECE